VVEIAAEVAVVETEAVPVVTTVVEIAAEVATEKGAKAATMAVHLAENTRAAMIENHNAVIRENPADGVLKTSVGHVATEIRRGVFI
jgi:hypothetical protein